MPLSAGQQVVEYLPQFRRSRRVGLQSASQSRSPLRLDIQSGLLVTGLPRRLQLLTRSLQLPFDHVFFATAIPREERDHAVTRLCPGVRRHLLDKCRSSCGSKCHQLSFHRTPFAATESATVLLHSPTSAVLTSRSTRLSGGHSPAAACVRGGRPALVFLPDLPDFPAFRVLPGFIGLAHIPGLIPRCEFRVLTLRIRRWCDPTKQDNRADGGEHHRRRP